MTELVYSDYLESRQWKMLRDRLVRRAMHSCELCGRHASRGKNGSQIGLNVHHLTYERLGHELGTDLAVLCRQCHEDIHQLPQEDPKRSLKAIRLATSFATYAALVSGAGVPEDKLDQGWLRRYVPEPERVSA